VASGGCPTYSKVNTRKMYFISVFCINIFDFSGVYRPQKCFSVEGFYGLILCFFCICSNTCLCE